MHTILRIFPLLVMALTVASPALAHVGHDIGGFKSGLLHPISGLDHIVAMIAVGLWGGILGAPALWLLPVIFPLAMAVAGVAGILGIPLPGIEIGIAVSGIVLGLMVLLSVKAPLWLAVVLVGFFAVFHGYAHGAELPEAADPVVYAVGFVMATGLLHLLGIAIGQIGKWPLGRIVVRAGGGLIALAGASFLIGAA